MTTWWRSSKLTKIRRHCLAAIHPAFDGMEDRRIYGVGTAAHDVYSAVQKATNRASEELDPVAVSQVARAAIEKGAEAGRHFEGEPEPPLRADDYLQGKELALDWLAARPAQPGRETEIAITIDRWGMIVSKDSPRAWMRGILDLLWTDDERVVVIPDLKTDWPSTEKALHSAQRRIQMLLAFASKTESGGQISGLRPEIWNLRRMKIYPREEDREQWTLDVESMGVLDDWREDLVALTDGYQKALDRAASPEKLASPGLGCRRGGGCPALAQCKAGQQWVARRGADDVGAAIVQQPVLWAESARLRELLEPIAEELGTIEADNMECGFEARPGFEPRHDAVLELWREFRGSQIANPIDCLCQGQDPECLMCSGVGQSIDWERELNRQRALLVTFLRAIRIGNDLLENKILPKLWPLVGVPRDERESNRKARALLLDRLRSPVKKPSWFVREKSEPAPGSTLVEKIEQSIQIAMEKKRFQAENRVESGGEPGAGDSRAPHKMTMEDSP